MRFRFWRTVLIMSLVAAVLLAAFMLSAAWQHNPQCEFHCDDGTIHWDALLLLGAAWAIAGFLAALPVASLAAWAIGRVLRSGASR